VRGRQVPTPFKIGRNRHACVSVFADVHVCKSAYERVYAYLCVLTHTCLICAHILMYVHVYGCTYYVCVTVC
jgi:hypothetical protein